MIKVGVVLIFFAIIFLIVCMFSPSVIYPLSSLYCADGQKLSSRSDTSSFRPGETSTSITFYCVNSDNVKKVDVSGSVMVTVMGGFFVLLFGGVILTSIGSSSSYRGRKFQRAQSLNPSAGVSGITTWNSTSSAATEQIVNDLRNGMQQGVIRFGGQEIHVDDLKAGNYQINVRQGNKHTLADTLRQLKDASDQGLIDSDEYGRLRQEALDKLV